MDAFPPHGVHVAVDRPTLSVSNGRIVLRATTHTQRCCRVRTETNCGSVRARVHLFGNDVHRDIVTVQEDNRLNCPSVFCQRPI